MQRKIKNILSSVLFLLGLLILLVLTSLFFRPKNNTEAHGMEEQRANGILGEPEQTIDVLFLGDSISYCSIIPMQIWRDHGITSYLCATSLQELYYSKEFLLKAFETQSPQVVFLGTSTIFNEFMYKENARAAVERVFPVFRYHDRWKTLDTFPELEEGLHVEYTYQEIGKGYYYSLASEAVNVGDYDKPTDVIEEIPADCKTTLKEIKELCDEKNAKLVLLSEPNAAGAWGPHRHNAIALLAEELGLEYLDINHVSEEVPIDWSTESFDGGDHLNYFGAKKVTAYLGSYLANMNIFQDKRTDVRYDSWNEAQKAFYDGKPL